MQLNDIAIPILPSRSIVETVAFYELLGFESKVWGPPNNYAILRLDTIEIHFFTHRELIPGESSAGCYIRVSDVDHIHQKFVLVNLPPIGIPRMDALEKKPWGMHEFAIVDPDGNLLRIGQTL